MSKTRKDVYEKKRKDRYVKLPSITFSPKVDGSNSIWRVSWASYGTKYSRMDQVIFYKGGLPQILLGPFLNNLSHVADLYRAWATDLKFSKLIYSSTFVF